MQITVFHTAFGKQGWVERLMPGHSLLKETDASLTSWAVLVTGISVLVFLGSTPVPYSVSGLLGIVFNLDIASYSRVTLEL